MNPEALPIQKIRSDLREALKKERRLVLQAPTGSGKSTQIPQMLLDENLVAGGRIEILQPRRIAARMLAKRVAMERRVPLGEGVGFQVRFENVSGPQTRIKYVTEGILLRRMMKDPELSGVGAVIFDEFHERHLYGEVTLAKALRLQKRSRPDLLIIVMSATIDPSALLQYLQPCVHFDVEGWVFPVEIEYAGDSEGGSGKPVWERAARHCNGLAKRFREGDFLIFMPGAFEINRTVRELGSLPMARDFVVLPLFGDLPPEQQDAALERYPKRKIVVSTNVAETSLTIDGVRVVLDSGLARIPAFDPHRGINTLSQRKISRAAADQRAGRCGRTGPGFCLRMWSEKEQQHRPARESPEVQRLDLSEIALTLKAGGEEDLEAFPWFERPGKHSLKRALSLLIDLGAMERETGSITETGRRMAAFPLHPRFGRMFLTAMEYGCLKPIALMAAFAQGRPFLLPLKEKRRREERDELLRDASTAHSDFFYLLRAWDFARTQNFRTGFCRKWGIQAHAARQAGRLLEQFLRIAGREGLKGDGEKTRAEDIQRCLLTGFSDHLARRLDRGTLRCAIIHGRKGELSKRSVVREAPLFVSAEIEERDVKGEVAVLLGLNTAVREEWLRELFPDDFAEEERVVYDPGLKRVCRRIERRFRDLVLDSKTIEAVPEEEAARLLADEIESGNLILKGWDAAVENWISRVNFIAHHFPEREIEPIGKEARSILLEQICFGATRYREIKNRPVWPILKEWLLEEQLPSLDQLAPETFPLPRRKAAKIRYGTGGKATLSATIQELYDAPEKLRIGGGKIPLLIEILAPNRRPVQVTDNLGEFWKISYPEIKKQLQGRYPKHEWR